MKFSAKPIIVEAIQWFKNGDHPEDGNEKYIGSTGQEFQCEGKVVRYFRHPNILGDMLCCHCNKISNDHGWIDTPKGGRTVCPGDWIIKSAKGEFYQCKDETFTAIYDQAELKTTNEHEYKQAEYFECKCIDYFECKCTDDEHRLVFTLADWNLDDDGKATTNYQHDVELYLSVFLSPGSFWQRLSNGIKYILGYKSRYGHFGNWSLDQKDTDRLVMLLQKFKSIRNNYC